MMQTKIISVMISIMMIPMMDNYDYDPYQGYDYEDTYDYDDNDDANNTCILM